MKDPNKRLHFYLDPIPPATEIELTVPCFLVDGADDGEVIDCRFLAARYRCLDCGWETDDRRQMLEHQEQQARHHTLCQRLRRAVRSSWERLTTWMGA